MLIGELNFNSATPVYTPIVSRFGESAVFVIEALQITGGTSSLAVDIEHKNRSDTSWTTAASFTAITTTGVKTKDASALKEQVRLKFTQSANAGDWSRVFVHPPLWR